MVNVSKQFVLNHVTLMSHVLIALCLFSQLSLAQERRIDPEIQRQIDDVVQNIYLPGSESTSLGLTVVQNDEEILYTTGYGLANIEKGIPYRNTTQFLVGSVSKSFTAVLAVKHLHERFPELGESVLDTPIRTLLPQVNFTLVDRFRSEQATFRDIIGHRICLLDQPLMAEPFDTKEELIFRMRYNGEVCGMRSQYFYSNQMLVMTAWLTNHLADKPYEEAMQDLWNELGMLNTTFSKRTDNFTEMPYRAWPYYLENCQTHPMNTDLLKRVVTSNPAGGIYSTPNDLARYLRFHLNLGSIDGKEIVPKDVMKWLTKPTTILPQNWFGFKQSDEEDSILHHFAYGLGLFIASYDGWEYIHHGGYYPPYRNQMSFYPSKKLGIFSNTHMGPSRMDPLILHAHIFEILNGNKNATEKISKLVKRMKVEEKEKERRHDQEFQNGYATLVKTAKVMNNSEIKVGKYGNGLAGELELSERFNEEANQTQYFIDYGKWYQGWLELLEGDSLFQIIWTTDVVQDDYAVGVPVNAQYALIQDDTVTLFGINLMLGQVGTFKLGVELDLLPIVPWDPQSC